LVLIDPVTFTPFLFQSCGLFILILLYRLFHFLIENWKSKIENDLVAGVPKKNSGFFLMNPLPSGKIPPSLGHTR